VEGPVRLRRNQIVPICRFIFRKSKLFQASTIIPSWIRTIAIPVNKTGELLAAIPRWSPVCFPRTEQRATTLSPSAIMSSTITSMSGNAPRKVAWKGLNPLGPLIGLLSSSDKPWATPSASNSSSMASAFPLFQTSSNQRRSSALFSFILIRDPRKWFLLRCLHVFICKESSKTQVRKRKVEKCSRRCHKKHH